MDAFKRLAPMLSSLVAIALTAGPASALALGGPPRGEARSPDRLQARPSGAPLELPEPATAVNAGEPPTPWIVGARPGRASAAVARRHGGRPLGGGAYAVHRNSARALASDLQRSGALVYAEPDRIAHAAQAPASDPLSSRARWRDAIVSPGSVPPATAAGGPVLGLVHTAADLSHPEFQGGQVRSLLPSAPTDRGGTAAASVAAAPVNGVGIVGVWPGMEVAISPLPGPSEVTCAQVTRRVRAAIETGATVIAMGYGFPGDGDPGEVCFSQYAALQEAVRKGIVPVASAGMVIDSGEQLGEPGTLPHVVTVGAVDAHLQPAEFMVASGSVDLTAPGVGVVAAVPSQFDQDGTVDGYRASSGTDLPAAMAGAAAAWLQAVRPGSGPGQVAAALRAGARDIGAPGHDRLTGAGMLQVTAAAALVPPVADPREPNEDIGWVDGRLLRPAQRPLWAGGRTVTIRAHLDRFEDPHDVYPIRLERGASARIRLRREEGTAAIAIFDARARSIEDRRRRIVRIRPGGAPSRALRLRNTSRRTRTFHLAVSAADEPASYVLSVGRLH